MSIDTRKTAAAIAAYRQRMNLSQQGLASLMNVTHQAVSKWENALALPDTEILLALAKLFGTSMEDLLLGVLPTEEILETEAAPMQEAPNEETEAASTEWDQLDFGSVMNMLPFVSTKVADQLFRNYYHNTQPDVGQLSAIAPFVSIHALIDCIGQHPLTDCSPEVLCSLAPFLPPKTVDELIQGLNGPVPPHMMQILIPFASPKAVDEMVLNKLGIQLENSVTHGAHFPLSEKAQQKIEVIQQKAEDFQGKFSQQHGENEKNIAQQEPDKRESPRMRLVRKMLERGNNDLVSEMASDLSDAETRQLCTLLMEKGMYDALSEVIDDLNEEALHDLLDKAFEIDDPELLHIISEHI